MSSLRFTRLAATMLVALVASGCGSGAAERPAGVAASAEETRPLAVGAKLPAIELRDVEGRAVSVGAFVAEGPIALVFYRGGW